MAHALQQAWDFDEITADELAALEAAERAVAAPPRRKSRRLSGAARQAGGVVGAVGAGPCDAARSPLRAVQLPEAEQPQAAAVPPAHGAPTAHARAAAQLPLLRYHGRVETAATAEEVDAAVAAVYRGGHAAIGFDIEWRVTFERGTRPLPVALMQLALAGSAASGPPCVYLLQLAHTGLTPALVRLLQDAAVAKAGCAAHNDAHKVMRDFGVAMDGVVDLSELAGTRLLPHQRWSLAALTDRLLARLLPKPSGVRLCAWDARTLSAEQTAYAALDAWASLRCHAALAQLPQLPPPARPPALALPLGAPVIGSGIADAGRMPALPAPTPLPPAKLAVLEHHLGGASVAHIAAARGVKAITVENYLSDALTGGHAYVWHLLGVDDGVAALVDAAVAAEEAQAASDAAAEQPPADAGGPSKPPEAAAGAGAAPLSASGAAAAADVAMRGRLKALKARLPEAVSFSALRLVLAHRARQAQLAALAVECAA